MKSFAFSATLGVLLPIMAQIEPGIDWLNVAVNGGAMGLLAIIVIKGPGYLRQIYEEIRRDRHDDRNQQQQTLAAFQLELKEQRLHDSRHNEKMVDIVQSGHANQMTMLNALKDNMAAFKDNMNILAATISRLNREDPVKGDQIPRRTRKPEQES